MRETVTHERPAQGTTPRETRRPRRLPLVRSRLYRLLVPATVALVAAGTLIVLALAAAVLLGVLPYPGR